jgi:methylenetetrahydrofolate dehydrogenase (NADP+)/methenyltetrahydrofolate cyclohydrolase
VTARLIDGRQISADLKANLRDQGAVLAAEIGVPPTLAVVWAGADPAAERYTRQIRRDFERGGFLVQEFPLSEETREEELIAVLHRLDADPAIHGVLVQTPLPRHMDFERVALAIPVRKDVDCVHPTNAGFLFASSGHYFAPATPLGGMELLDRIGVSPQGKRAVVVGRSPNVGKPMAMMLLHRNATVTICHSHTDPERLREAIGQADIVVAAAGRAGLICGDWIRPGAVVIDFGVNFVGEKMVGDVEFDTAAQVASAITPVPGGTGPMTVAMLMKNTLLAARHQVPAAPPDEGP